MPSKDEFEYESHQPFYFYEKKIHFKEYYHGITSNYAENYQGSFRDLCLKI